MSTPRCSGGAELLRTLIYTLICMNFALWLCSFTFRTLSIFCHYHLYFSSRIAVFALRAAQPFLFWKVLSRHRSQDISQFSVSLLIKALDVKYPFLIWQFHGSCTHSPWILSKTSLSGDISKLIMLFRVAWLPSCAYKLHTLPLRNTAVRILSRPLVLTSCYW